MTFSRDLLVRAFPNDPLLRAQFEALDELLSSTADQAAKLKEDLAAVAASLPEGAFQPFSELLQSLSEVPDSALGAIEIVALDTFNVRPIDTADDACLVSRSNLISYVGKGATGARPALSAQHRAIYFDTTLAAAGKPVFWTGTAWVDATGAVV